MKRSSQVALLLMGTVAVGGGAYALMPSENCPPPNQAGVTQPGGQQNQNCHRSWRSSGSTSSGGYSGYHSGYGSSSSSSSLPHLSSQQHFSGSGTSHGGSSSTTPVSRGGFGSFSSHFSGGG